MPPHLLTNLEMQKYYENKPKCNGVYLRDNLPKAKYGVYVVNLNEYESVRTHGVNGDNVTYFDWIHSKKG